MAVQIRPPIVFNQENIMARKAKRSGVSMAKPMESINIRKADNGFVISGWNQKTNKEMTHVAKSKAEAKRVIDGIFK